MNKLWKKLLFLSNKLLQKAWLILGELKSAVKGSKLFLPVVLVGLFISGITLSWVVVANNSNVRLALLSWISEFDVVSHSDILLTSVFLLALGTVLYTMIDFRLHLKPLKISFPDIKYRVMQHLKKVILPRMRYNWAVGAKGFAGGFIGFVFISGFLALALVRGEALNVTVDGSGTKLISYEKRPLFTGAAPKSSEISVAIDGGASEQVPVGEDGAWSYRPGQDLDPGDHQMSITSNRTGNFRYFLYGGNHETSLASVKVYDVQDDSFIGSIKLSGAVPADMKVVDSVGRAAALTHSSQQGDAVSYLDIIDTTTSKIIKSIELGSQVNSMKLDESSGVVWLFNTNGNNIALHAYSIVDGSLIATHAYAGEGVNEGSGLVNGSRFALVSSSFESGDGYVRIFGQDGQILRSIALSNFDEYEYIYSTVVSQDSDYLFVVTNLAIRRYSLQDGNPAGSILPPSNYRVMEKVALRDDGLVGWAIVRNLTSNEGALLTLDFVNETSSLSPSIGTPRIDYGHSYSGLLINSSQTTGYIEMGDSITRINLADGTVTGAVSVSGAAEDGYLKWVGYDDSSGIALLTMENIEDGLQHRRLYTVNLTNLAVHLLDTDITSVMPITSSTLYYTKKSGSEMYGYNIASGLSARMPFIPQEYISNSPSYRNIQSHAIGEIASRTVSAEKTINFFVAVLTIESPLTGVSTHESTVRIEGQGPADYRVEILVDGTVAGVTTVDSTGRWSYLVESLSAGQRRVSARLYRQSVGVPIIYTNLENQMQAQGNIPSGAIGLQQLSLEDGTVEMYSDVDFAGKVPVAFSPDGKHAFTIDFQAVFTDPGGPISLYKYDNMARQESAQMVLPGLYTNIVFTGTYFNSDGSKLYIIDLLADKLIAVNTNDLTVDHEVQLADFNAEGKDMLGMVIGSMKQSQDKKRIFIADWDGQAVQVYDTETGELSRINTEGGTYIYQLALSPDAERVYVGTSDGFRIVDVESSSFVGIIPSLSGWAAAIKFPAGSSDAFLASLSYSGEVLRVTRFDPLSGAVVSSEDFEDLNLNDSTWFSMATPVDFSHDGSVMLVTEEGSPVLRRYRMADREELQAVRLSGVPSGLFSVGDNRYVINTQDGSVALYNENDQSHKVVQIGGASIVGGSGMLQTPTPQMILTRAAGSDEVSVDVTVTDSSGVEFDFVTESLPDITLGTFGSDEVYRQSIQVSGPADSSWYCGLEHAITGGNLPANFRYRVEGDCFSRTAYLVGAVDTLSAGQYNVILQTTDPASGYAATKEYQITVHAAMQPAQFTGSTARVVDITSVIQETGGRLRIKGVGPAGKRVDIYNDNTLVGSANVAASGMWESVVSGVMPGQQNLSARWSTEGAVSFLPVSNILEQDSSQVVFSQIAIIDLQDGTTIKEVPLPSGHLGVSVSARQNNKAYILTINANPASGQGTDTASVLEYSLDSGRLIKVFDVKASGSIAQMQIGPAGDSLYILTSTGVSEYSFGGELLRSASVSMDAGGTMGSFMAVYREMGISNDGNRVIVPTWWSYGDFPITTHIFDLDSSEYTSRADTSVPGGSKEQFTSSFTIGDKIYMVYSRGYVQIIDQRTAEVLDTFNFDLECDNGTGYCENLLSASYNPQSNVITASITIMSGSENREYSYEIREMDIETGDFDIISAPAGSWRILAHSQDYEKMYLFPSSLKMNGSAGSFPDNIYVFNTSLRTFSAMGPVLSGIPIPYSTSSQMSVFGASFSDSVSVAVESWGGEVASPVNPTPVLPSAVPGEDSERVSGSRTLVISRPGVDTLPEAVLTPVPASGLPDVIKNMYENVQKRTATTDESTGFIDGMARFFGVKPIAVVRGFPWVVLFSLTVLLLVTLIQLLRRLYFARKMKQMVQHQELLNHEKKSLLSLASHYLRTPLTILGAGVDQLPEESRARQKISTASNNLADVVKRLVGSIADDEALGTLVKPVAAQHQRASLLRLHVLIPAFLSIGLIIAINIVAVYGAHLSPGASHIAAQVVVWCALVGGLYVLYDARDQQQEIGRYHQRLLTHEESLDSARNTFIRSVSEELTPVVIAVDAAVPPGLPEDSTKYIKEGLRQFESTLQHFLLISQLERQVLKQRARAVNLKSSIRYAKKVSAYPGVMMHSRIDAAALVEQPESLIRRVFSSLIDNAAEHSPQHQPVEVISQNNKDDIQVEFRDHGEGISVEKMKLLFKPLSRIESAEDFTRQGMGLSLYVNRLIMHYLGGEITAESSVGKGTVMRLRIPKQFLA